MSYYAEYCKYYIDTISDEDCLARFDTKEERDEWVERMDASSDGYKFFWHSVTRREVAHRYDFKMFYGDEEEELNGERTCKGKCIFFIPHKAGYDF